MMTDSNLTRAFYEGSPYPPPLQGGPARWMVAPLPWLLTLDQESPRLPRRVFVAGCGTGAEAFAVRAALPAATVVAADFSPASIRVAQQTQRDQPAGKRIRFMTADLTRHDLANVVGRSFDLIVCHGVLSYIPKPVVALRQLAQCLSPGGRLCLGVNGAAHFSTPLRRAFRRLGIDPSVLPRDRRWRRLLQLQENIDGGATPGFFSGLPDWYMGGDCFGPVLHSLDLAAWNRLFRRAGLYFHGSFGTHRALRTVMASDATALFMPGSRDTVAEVLDHVHPASFHHLLLAKHPVPQPPWADPTALLAWRPKLTGFYRLTSRQRPATGGPLRISNLRSSVLDTKIAWPLPAWTHEILRRSQGRQTLRELLADQGRPGIDASFLAQAYLFHHLAVWNLFPASTARTHLDRTVVAKP